MLEGRLFITYKVHPSSGIMAHINKSGRVHCSQVLPSQIILKLIFINNEPAITTKFQFVILIFIIFDSL